MEFYLHNASARGWIVGGHSGSQESKNGTAARGLTLFLWYFIVQLASRLFTTPVSRLNRQSLATCQEGLGRDVHNIIGNSWLLLSLLVGCGFVAFSSCC